MATITQNINRLYHLLELFNLSKEDFLGILNKQNKRIIVEKDVFSTTIKSSILKQIDYIFCKGLPYYLDPEDPIKRKEESIFFRKEKFNIELNLTAKQVINKFETEKILFSALERLADIDSKRSLPIYRISDKPEIVAKEIRNKLIKVFRYPKNDREFLKDIISILAEFNVLIFEYVEARNKKLKANFDGFYISPNTIVIKWQKYTKRQIFTLLHELGHYLLNKEDIDDTIQADNLMTEKNLVEKWCNDFAFYFLIGSQVSLFESLSIDDDISGYKQTLDELSKMTHLSLLALYTKLYYQNKINHISYLNIVNDLRARILLFEETEKQKKELEKDKLQMEGKKLIIPQPKPTISPLYRNTLELALYNGLLNEMEFCKKIHIKPTQLESYLA